MKNLLKLLSIIFVFSFLVACNDDGNDSPILTAEENILVNNEWNSTGIFANGTLVPGTDFLKIKLDFQSLGVPGVPGAFQVGYGDGGLVTAPALWAYSNGQMTITYPDVQAGLFSDGAGGLTPTNETIEATVQEGLLELKAPATGEITFLNLITIPQSNVLQFTPDGSSVSSGSNSTLAGTTWSAQPVQVLGNTVGVDLSDPAFTIQFQSYFGVNVMLVDNIPTPSTWTLNADNTKLIVNYPASISSTNAAGAEEFDIVTGSVSSNEFVLGNENTTASITLYGVAEIGAGVGLRLTKQ